MSVVQSSGGATFELPDAYAAAAAVVSDGVMALATKYLLTSATAAFSQLMQGLEIVVAGAGAAGADLTTRIEEVISATKVRLRDPALTAVSSADLTYVVGVYRIRNLLLAGDIDDNTYDVLYVRRLQVQVNQNTPGGIVYIGGEQLTPTNAGTELIAAGASDNDNMGVTLGDFITSDQAGALVNILWECN
jgi:hypothetical protein